MAIPSIQKIRRLQQEYGCCVCPECGGDMYLYFNDDVLQFEEHCHNKNCDYRNFLEVEEDEI